MKTESKKRFHKIVSFVLAAVIMVSVFSVAAPQKAEAAGLTLKGSGSSSAKITDQNCWAVTKKPNYIKFKSNVTGSITLKLANASNVSDAYGYMTFCNSKKKALGKTREIFDTSDSRARLKTRTYGVKKGTTYYIKIESVGGVKISASVKSIKKSAGTKLANAKSLGKNKTINGVIIAGSKTADWYKIRLTKKQLLKLSYTVNTNGAVPSGNSIYYYNGIKFTLYESNGKKFVDDYAFGNLLAPKDTVTYYVENKQSGQKSGLKPGTYYIKVERYNPTSSGSYTLKWK